MSLAYRMRIINGTAFTTSSTSLTPAAGASHSEAFQITTLSSGSLAGYAPYMRIPRGQNGEFDIKTGRSSVGAYTVEILDARTQASSNATRWVSAFIGDSSGRLSIVGKKAIIEESTDGGSTWNLYFCGRVNKFDLSSKLTYTAEIGDNLELLKQKIFATEAVTTSSVYKSVLPLGIMGQLQMPDSSSALPETPGFFISKAEVAANANTQLRFDRWLTLANASVQDQQNFWSFGEKFNTSAGLQYDVYAGQQPLRARIDISGSYYYYGVDILQTPSNANPDKTLQQIQKIHIAELDTSDPRYSSIGSIPIQTFSNIQQIPKIWIYALPEAEPVKGTLFINATPYEVLKDILTGSYFPRSNPQLSIPFDTGSISTLETLRPLEKMVYRIEESMEAAEFIEKHICKPYGFGYTFEPQLVNNIPQSVLRLFSTYIPTSSAGLSTLDDTSVIAGTDQSWNTNEPVLAVGGMYYIEKFKTYTRDTLSAAPSEGMTNPTIQEKFPLVYALTDTIDPSVKIEQLDFNGLRGLNGDIATNSIGGTAYNSATDVYVNGRAVAYLKKYFDRNQFGNPLVQLICIRNATTNGLKVGDFVLVDVDVLPNQALHTRGGTRIYQIVQKNVDGIQIEFNLLDSGVNQTMTAPSFGIVSCSVANQIDFQVSIPSPGTLEIDYAVMPSGSAVPANSSVNWIFYQSARNTGVTQSFSIDTIPEGRTTYIRARTTSPSNADIKLPSPYTIASPVTLANISAPTSLAVSNITAKSAEVNWTNTNALFPIEVKLASPQGEPITTVIQLPASSSTFDLTGLDLNTNPAHTVGIRYIDAYKGFSPLVTASFTATGTTPQLDAPAALITYITR
jgi:hypothetical protein